jgi:hypothetical protein
MNLQLARVVGGSVLARPYLGSVPESFDPSHKRTSSIIRAGGSSCLGPGGHGEEAIVFEPSSFKPKVSCFGCEGREGDQQGNVVRGDA